MFEEVIAPLLATEWGRRLGLGLSIVMGCLLFYTGLNMLFVWRADYLIAHPKASHTTPLAVDHTMQWILQIPQAHLFGQQGSGESANLPVTGLQLHLVGVIKATPEKYSRVIIADGSQPGKVYQVGDVLSSGAKIFSIIDEGVVLENNGKLEKLLLHREGVTFQGMPQPLLSDKPEE